MHDEHFEKLLTLLELEREAEKEENKRELERFPLHVREALGKTVTRLKIVGEDVGVGNLPLLRMTRSILPSKTRGRRGESSENLVLSPFHAMNQGDNVLLTFPATRKLKPVEGTLYDVSDLYVVVALNVAPPDDLPDGLCQLDLLGSDATYKRMRQALGLVKRSEKLDLVRLREIFLGNTRASASDHESFNVFNERLNEFQVQAVKQCLAANDVSLVHGPPGTGKTTVLVEVILQAVKRGARVLASAPSNIAVDNMVEKLLKWDLRIVRMGHPARILEPLRHVTLSAQEENHPARELKEELEEERRKLLKRKKTGRGLEYEEERNINARLHQLTKELRDFEFGLRRQIVQEAQVVLATHGGVGGVLNRQKFDLVVMDEASQATEPLSWVPITLAKKVIFAGDSLQLPPTIYSKKAAEDGLAHTLFDRLKKNLKNEFQSLLRIQYRMHNDIMRFSSDKFYEGKLLADETVKSHLAKDLPNVEKTELTSRPVLFIDTAGTGYSEVWNELLESRENEGEANLTMRVYEKLRKMGITPDDIAIITPYVAQVKKIRAMALERMEIGSVDSFQGREKEVVILSLVRSNETGEVGFLSDTRRMNVAMTRARRLLVVIGDSATISRHPFYHDFLNYIEELDAHGSAWEWIES